MALAATLPNESVVLVEGRVVARPETMRNPEMETGAIEIACSSVRLVGPAETPAIPVARGKTEKAEGALTYAAMQRRLDAMLAP